MRRERTGRELAHGDGDRNGERARRVDPIRAATAKVRPRPPRSRPSPMTAASQRVTEQSSSRRGNLAISKWPSSPRTDAVGRAPPSEVPDARSNCRSSSVSSSSMNRLAAPNGRGRSTSAGTDLTVEVRKRPVRGFLKRSAPSRASSSTSIMRSKVRKVLGWRPSARARRRSLRRRSACPQRSGAESVKALHSGRSL